MASMWIPNPKKPGHFLDAGSVLDGDGNVGTFDDPNQNADAASRHDQAHGRPGEWVPIPPAWNTARLMPSGPLTDEAIAKWRKRGYRFDADTPGLVTRTAAAKKEAKRGSR